MSGYDYTWLYPPKANELLDKSEQLSNSWEREKFLPSMREDLQKYGHLRLSDRQVSRFANILERGKGT